VVREIADRRNALGALCRQLGVEKLFLFGSAARQATLADTRDIDFLVEFKPMSPQQYADSYFLLAEKLEEMFGRPVDLVEADRIDNPYFQDELNETRVPLYELA
jgi:uncharacterized protein